MPDGGYAVSADPEIVDLHRFQRLLGQARAVGLGERAAVLFEQALALWRGEPFAGLDTPWFAAEREALRRQRITAELDRNDVALALGRHAALLDSLATTADANPHDERLAAVLGTVCWWRGELSPAVHHLSEAVALCRQISNRALHASALTGLGAVCWRRGDLEPATDHLQQALTLLRQIGDRANEAQALTFLGGVCWQRGDLEPATAHVRQALSLCRQVGDRATEASALTLLGLIDAHRGGRDRAVEHLHQGLALARQAGDRVIEADALTALGVIHGQCGVSEPAVVYLQQARDLCRQIGYRPGEADALNALGDVLQMRGSLPHTPAEQAHVVTSTIEIGSGDRRTGTRDATTTGPHPTNDLDQARQHWKHALAIYTDLNLPHAESIRVKLDHLDRQPAT